MDAILRPFGRCAWRNPNYLLGVQIVRHKPSAEMIAAVARAVEQHFATMFGAVLHEGPSPTIEVPAIRFNSHNVARTAILAMQANQPTVDGLLERLTFAAGELVVATDGMEDLRPQRQAVLDAISPVPEAMRCAAVVSGS